MKSGEHVLFDAYQATGPARARPVSILALVADDFVRAVRRATRVFTALARQLDEGGLS